MWITLTFAGGGPVIVQVANILYFSPGEKDGTVLVMAPGTAIGVRETMKEVLSMIGAH